MKKIKLNDEVRKSAIILVILMMFFTFWMIIFLNFGSGQQESIGDDYVLFQNVTLIQNCECNEVVFTRVYNPSNELILFNETAVQNGTAFSHITNGTLNNQIGIYIVTGHGNLSNTGLLQTFAYTYEIKRTGGWFGLDFTEPINIIFTVILALGGLALLFKKKYFYLGVLVFFTGLVGGLNGVVWFLTFPLVIMGVVLISVGYKDVNKTRR